MNEIIIVSDNHFPRICAATTRIYMLCRIFQSLNYKTTVFIINAQEKKRFRLDDENIDCRWFTDDSSCRFRYLAENEKLAEVIKKRENLKYVILYQEILLQTLSLHEIAEQQGFEIIAYFDEWYEWGSSGHTKFIDRFTRSLSIRISEYIVAPKIKKKIVISRTLKRFYRRDDCLLLPTLVDLSDSVWEKDEFEPNDQIVIVYAGWPANRDDLRMLVEVVDKLPKKDKERILLKIYTYDTDRSVLRRLIPDLDRIERENRGIIQFLGEVTREEVIGELKKANFAYLLRKNKLSNNAGFSTKIGESLASGVPMLANCTSDIGYYIKDGFNGILINDMSKAAVKSSLERILGLSDDELAAMKINAYKTAVKYFDYRRYKERMKEFLER